MNEQRYHPLWMLHELWNLLREIVSFILFYFVVIRNSDLWLFTYGKYFVLVYFAVRLIAIPVQWYISTYQVSSHAITIRRKGLGEQKQTVPFSKVQHVHRKKKLFHKWTGTTSMKLEVASQEDKTVDFKVLKLEDADWLEGLLVHTAAQDESENEVEEIKAEEVISPAEEVESEASYIEEIEESRHVHFTPSMNHIKKATFSSFSFLAVIPIFGSLLSKFEKGTGKTIVFSDFLNSYGDTWWKLSLWGIAAVLACLVGGFIWTYIRYSRHEISSDSEGIYIKKGFFEETSFSISKKQVQAVEFRQTFIKRLLSLTEVKLISAGGEEEGEEINKLYPFLTVQEAERLVQELLPDYKVSNQMHRLPRRALILRLLTPSWVWIIATPLLYFFAPYGLSEYWAWLSGVLLLLVITSRVLDVRYSEYTINGSLFQVKKGGFYTKCLLVKRNKIEEMEKSANIFQKWVGLASLSTTVRANPVQVVKVDDLPSHWTHSFEGWYLQRGEEVERLPADSA
ncbi:PH domain-containing protein [Halobacillus salinus]|uniref:PH domain-containing protein n=1 Tax=Halobacillus salinus TaxID=192814 RepID=UPI0009A82E0F|nr:PH domain-containing protein [Halobacillus salinus]